MKPDEARRRRLGQEARKTARGDALLAYIEEGNPMDRVVPELIPTAADRVRLEREIRSLCKKAEKHPSRSAARIRKLDDVIGLVARLDVVEKVLALDPLERAALTPAKLNGMATSSPKELVARLRELVAGVVGGGDAPQLEVPDSRGS